MHWVIGCCHSVLHPVHWQAALEACQVLLSLRRNLTICCSVWSMRGSHFMWRLITSMFVTLLSASLQSRGLYVMAVSCCFCSFVCRLKTDSGGGLSHRRPYRLH